MVNSKKNISESVDEIKNIPQGNDFSKLKTIYKVIRGVFADSYADRYHRKKSDGYTHGNNACYGIAGYTHMDLKGAMCLANSYGGTIVKMKLLGGFSRYVFFDAERDPDIKRELIGVYGNPLSVRDQLYVLTGSWDIANRYGNCSASSFGERYAEEIMRLTGKLIRGFICIYTYGTILSGGTYTRVTDVMVNPLVFSDMITCAVAKNVSSSDPIEQVESKFVGTLNKDRRDLQNNYVDIVPHLYTVNAKHPDKRQGARIGNKMYVSYTDMNNRHNMLVVDEENWGDPKDFKMFPDSIRLDYEPTNPTRKGTFYFYMGGEKYVANVCGMDTNEIHVTDDNSSVIFALAGFEEPGHWYAMTDEILEWIYNNHDDAMESLRGEYSEDEAEDSETYQQSAETNGDDNYTYDGDESNPEWYNPEQKVIEENFQPGMSYNDFVRSNVGKNNENIIYVCTHCYFVEGIMQKGFSRACANKNDFMANGGALTYGDGVYGTPSFNNAANSLSRKTWSPSEKPDGKKYGDIILKCVLMGGWKGFLIFDENFAKKIYGPKYQVFDQIDEIVKDQNARNVLKDFIRNECYGTDLLHKDGAGRTNHMIFKMFDNYLRGEARRVQFEKWTKFFRENGIRGAIYHGHGDGFCCVCYDYSEVIPIELSYDHGQTWTTKGFTRTLDYNGKTYTSKGIDWEKTSERLTAGGDPRAKLGAKYSEVDLSTQRINFNGSVVGLVQVKKHNGKYNFITMQDIPDRNGGVLYRKFSEIFPIDFDAKSSISAIKRKVHFVYRGISFEGDVYNEENNGPTITLVRKSKYPPYTVAETYDMQNIDWFVDNYDAYIRGDFEEDGEENYESQDDVATDQQLQEEFFRMLDRIELI